MAIVNRTHQAADHGHFGESSVRHLVVQGLDDTYGAKRVDVDYLEGPFIVDFGQVPPLPIHYAGVVDQEVNLLGDAIRKRGNGIFGLNVELVEME